MKKKRIVIFLYNRLFDPLIQSNFWLYILDFLSDDKSHFEFHLITYENPQIPLTKEQEEQVSEWESRGLKWTRLNWNEGTGLKAKLIDVIQGFFIVMRLRVTGHKHIVSLASVAGTFVYLYSIFLRTKFFLYQYEPHSEYAIDNEMWSPTGFNYRVSNYLEKKAAYRARVISSGTRFMEERLKEDWKVAGSFFKIPTVANDGKFIFSKSDRAKTRSALGFSESTYLLFYPGKFGDLYYREEAAFMFKWLKKEIPALHFLIVTPHSDDEVIAIFECAGVEREQYTIAHSDYSDIHTYFSAADFAVISVPPGPSKKFISNIKVGEYLCAGLPFLITRGISEDYLYAIEKKVGVVVDDFKEQFVRPAAEEVLDYLQQDRDELRDHCREVGLDYRGFKRLNRIFKEAIKTLVE